MRLSRAERRARTSKMEQEPTPSFELSCLSPSSPDKQPKVPAQVVHSPVNVLGASYSLLIITGPSMLEIARGTTPAGRLRGPNRLRYPLVNRRNDAILPSSTVCTPDRGAPAH